MPTDLSDLLKVGGHNRIRPERKDIWKVVLGTILFFAIITLYVLEFPYFSRTFGLKSLILWSSFLGIILGFIGASTLSKEVKDSFEKIKIFIFLISLSALTLPLFGSLSNRLLSAHPVVQESVEFVELKAYSENRFGLTKDDLKNGIKPSGYYLFFVRNDAIQRISLKTPLYQDTKRSEMINIPIQKGLWGYEIVFP